jgi:16S rRNA (cytosine967-C5)-methyltransferase
VGDARTGPNARRVALDVLERIEADGAYANLALGPALAASGLDERDRRFATGLVYGTTRMRRAVDFLVDAHLSHPPRRRIRNALRLGAFQLAFGDVAPHAAVAETVAVTPKAGRGLVNAVLRKVAAAVAGGPPAWPDEATRLSVPDWVWRRLAEDLGRERAVGALQAMNRPGEATVRADGYVQDAGSQEVAAAVPAGPGDLVLDVCAAPGGKATALAGRGARVVAADRRPGRLDLVTSNVAALGQQEQVLVAAADGAAPPWPAGAFGQVLVDAPCSGLGTLHRRADLRWRVEEGAVTRLREIQRAIVAASATLVRPGGTLTYSVCTLTSSESLEVDRVVADDHPEMEPMTPPPAPWEPWGRGAVLLPQVAGTDGMCLFRYRRAR